jgi:predicted metal-dependent hydrolase
MGPRHDFIVHPSSPRLPAQQCPHQPDGCQSTDRDAHRANMRSLPHQSDDDLSMTDKALRDFEPRPMRVEFAADLPRLWNDGDPFATHYMNALSLLFPTGEKFFIDAVRAYRDRIDDPQLSAQIRAFIGQEGWHRSVHADYNAWLERCGLPAAELDARAARKIAFIKDKLPARGWLAATVCLEHFTAIMAKDLLSTPSLTANMHPTMRQIWIWHAMEGLEHKAVAFDVYQATGGKYSTRFKAMLFVSVDFAIDTLRNLIALLRAEGKLWSPRVWWRGAGFLFGRSPGVFWRTLPGWLAFFRPSFHPWDDDASALIRNARQKTGLSEPLGTDAS